MQPQLRGAVFCWDLGGREAASKEGGSVGGKYEQVREVGSRSDGGPVWIGCHLAYVTAASGLKHRTPWQQTVGPGLSF